MTRPSTTTTVRYTLAWGLASCSASDLFLQTLLMEMETKTRKRRRRRKPPSRSCRQRTLTLYCILLRSPPLICCSIVCVLSVQDLISLICDVKMMKKQVIEIGYDAEKMPLGKLSKAHVQRAIAVLKKIEQAINDSETLFLSFSLCSRLFLCVSGSLFDP